MTKHLLAMAGLAIFSNSAFAANISFNFLVNSSGMDVYACDAGIWDPGVNGRQSNVQAKIRAYNSATPLVYSPTSVRGNPSWSSLFYTIAYPAGIAPSTTVASRFDNVIEKSSDGTGLVFNIASDTYGARYFVDLCVRGPNLPYLSGHYEYKLSDSVTAVDLLSAKYLTNAGVQAAGTVVCDERTGSPTEWSSSLIEEHLDVNYLELKGTGVVPAFPTGWGSPLGTPTINGTTVNVFGTVGSEKVFTTTAAPIKFCIVRFSFREMATTQRLWDPAQAKFTVNMNLENSLYTP